MKYECTRCEYTRHECMRYTSTNMITQSRGRSRVGGGGGGRILGVPFWGPQNFIKMGVLGTQHAV